MIQKSILAIFLVMLVVAVNGQTADEILEKYYKNTGGRAKWKAITTRKSEGKMVFQNMEMTVAILEKAGGKQRVQVAVQGQEVIQAYDGVDAWAINPFMSTTPTKLGDAESAHLKINNFPDPFLDYKNKGDAAELLGTEEVDGVQYYKLQLIRNKNNDKDDVTETYYFNKETYLPMLIISKAAAGPMQGQEVKTYMGDYREVDGVKTPFTLESKANGQTVQKIVFEKVTLNAAMDDALFSFPK
jgi:outer membrane lipoprotein-sorting protein